MAENTRMRDLQQHLDSLEQQFHTAELVREQQFSVIQETRSQFHESQQNLQASKDRMHQDLTRLIELQQSSSTAHTRGILGSGPEGIRSRQIKLDFPKFSSGDPTTWIIAAEPYFTFYQVPLPDRVNLAAFHLSDPVDSWFYGADQLGALFDWRDFCTALWRRFGPSEFEDPTGALVKLQQSGSILDYQSSFEKLVSKVPGLSPTMLCSIFIFGLKPHIRRSVLTQRPHDYHEAYSFARIYEDQANDHKPYRSWPSTAKNPLPAPTSTSLLTSSSHTPNTKTQPIPTIPIRYLSPAKIQVKREKNLCYNCDEKYSFGHKCKGGATLLYLEGT